MRQHNGDGDSEHPRFETRDTRIDARIEARFEAVDTRIDTHFEAVDTHFEAVDTRIEAAEARIEVGFRGQAGPDGAGGLGVGFRLPFLDAALPEGPRVGERIEFGVRIGDGHAATITRREDFGKRAYRFPRQRLMLEALKSGRAAGSPGALPVVP